MEHAVDYAIARRRMVREQLVRRGIRQRRLLQAFRTVPRHLFVDPAIGARAYEDCSLPIGFAQTISQPYTIAFMIEALELRPTYRVLEIGTGSGYQTAILSLLARDVFSIERHSELSRAAETVLKRLGTGKIRLKTGDGQLGWEYYAPYNRIIVSAATSQWPEILLGQLADGGALIAPVRGTVERLTLFHREGGRVRIRRLSPCAFVPMKQGVE